jgi:hypothetical protein
MLWAGFTGQNRWLIADRAAEIRCHCRAARVCSTQKSDLLALIGALYRLGGFGLRALISPSITVR